MSPFVEPIVWSIGRVFSTRPFDRTISSIEGDI